MNSVPTLPYLAPWYRVVCQPGKVVLEYGDRVVCLEGGAAERLVPALLPLLDGTRTVDEVVAVLGAPVRPAIECVLQELCEQGLLEAGPPPSLDLPSPSVGAAELLAALRPATQTIADTAAAVAECSVALVGTGAAAHEVARLLRVAGAGVEWRDELAGSFDLAVCAPGPAELPRLSEWNEQALERSQPWLQVLPFNGRFGAVGPLYLPGDTGCYECFRRRRAASLGALAELEVLEAAPGSYPSAPAIEAVLGGLAAQLALHWLVLGDHYVPAAFYALELLPTLSLGVHHLHRVPRCEACSGVADVAAPLPWFKEVPVAGVG